MKYELFIIGSKIFLGDPESGHLMGLDRQELGPCSRFVKGELTLEVLSNYCPDVAASISHYKAKKESHASMKCAYLHVTNKCNLDCIGCYSKNHRTNQNSDPSLEQLKKFLHFIKEWGASEICISGGEPFLRSDLSEILKEAKKCGMQTINVLTNGTLGDSSDLAKIAPFINNLSISFDCSSPLTPSFIRKQNRFSQLVEFVKSSKEAGINTCITPTIHGKNWNEIYAYIELANMLNVNVSFSLLSSASNHANLKDLQPDDIALKEISRAVIPDRNDIYNAICDLSCKNSCGAGKTMISITPNGDIFPCHMLHDERFLLGNACEMQPYNLKTHNFEKARKSISCNEKTCEYFYLCGGGCVGRAINSEQNVDPYCALSRSYFECLLQAF